MRIESSMCVARWFGVLFAVFQVTVFTFADAPGHTRPVGYALAGLLAVTNLAVRSALRRVDTLERARRLAWSTLLLDAAGVSGFVWLYSFDPTSSLYLLLFILPAEAALKFQASGAIVAWGACTTTYVLRELWASGIYGAEPEVTSITFRMGVLLIVSLLIAVFARKLADRSAELADALAELEGQERWRQALIDMLAHDLRSPVATATSTLLLIRDRIEHLSPDDVRGLTTAAVAQNQRALRLTEDLLDLARSQQGRLEMQLEDVAIGPLLQRVLATVPLAPADVRVVIDDGLVASVDPGR
ncbi:MAG: hypothetical protein KY461_11925, partial [Actinobacteria bacterium]|nr:hypothetical protein [Actinomycetota bacterium]